MALLASALASTQNHFRRAFSMLWRNNCIMVQLKNMVSPPWWGFFLPHRGFSPGDQKCAFSSWFHEHGIKAGTGLTSSIKPAGFLSLKELPRSAEGHHPPCLPARFSLQQRRLWTKPQSVNEHRHPPLRGNKGQKLWQWRGWRATQRKNSSFAFWRQKFLLYPHSQSSKSHHLQGSTALPRIQTGSVSLKCKAL